MISYILNKGIFQETLPTSGREGRGGVLFKSRCDNVQASRGRWLSAIVALAQTWHTTVLCKVCKDKACMSNGNTKNYSKHKAVHGIPSECISHDQHTEATRPKQTPVTKTFEKGTVYDRISSHCKEVSNALTFNLTQGMIYKNFSCSLESEQNDFSGALCPISLLSVTIPIQIRFRIGTNFATILQCNHVMMATFLNYQIHILAISVHYTQHAAVLHLVSSHTCTYLNIYCQLLLANNMTWSVYLWNIPSLFAVAIPLNTNYLTFFISQHSR